MTQAYSDTMTDLSVGDIVTAADMDLIRNNIESIHDQLIIFQEEQTAGNFSTTSGTWVEVTGCSVSVTTPVAMRVAIGCTGVMWNGGAASSTLLNVQVNGTVIDSNASEGIVRKYATNPSPVGFVRWHSLTAGTFTIRMVMQSTGGSTGYINNPVIQVVGTMEV